MVGMNRLRECLAGGLIAGPYTYAVKFARKKAGRKPDYVVPPLEALWWSEGGEEFDPVQRPEAVRWTVMVMQPDFIEAGHVAAGAKAVKSKLTAKKQPGNPALDELRLDALTGGRAAQMLYIGPYADMGPHIERLHRFIAAEGLSPASITMSISVIRCGRRLKSSRRSCGSRPHNSAARSSAGERASSKR